MSCLLLNPYRPSVIRWASYFLLLLCSFYLGGVSLAQDGGPEPAAGGELGPEAAAGEEGGAELSPEAAAAKAEKEAKAAVALAEMQAEALAAILEEAGALSAEQIAQLEKWIPHTTKRLQKRQPVHIAVLGDSVTRYMSYDDNRENSHYSYHGVFAAKLADEFFYTGGVRDIQPTKGHAAKLEPLLGPELVLENLGMNGRVSLHALSRITTDGLVNRPDLVVINFGINDALLGIGLATYVEALDRSVKLVKSTGADVILLGPSSTIRNPSAGELALTRAYSGAMEALAARRGIFYFDLGSVTTSAPGTREGLSAEQALEAIVASYNELYWDHGDENRDGLHPSPAAHQLMGSAFFKALRDGIDPQPYRLNGFLNLEGGGKATLEFKLKNLQETPAKGQLLLMPVSGMVPEAQGIPFDLPAGKGKVFRVSYQTRGGEALDFPSHFPRVYVPMIVTDAKRSYSPVFPAKVTPLAVVWETGAQDLSRRAFEIKCSLVSTGTAMTNGSYEASWNGQVARGEFSLQPGGSQSLALKFEVPSSGAEFSVRDELVLSLDTGGKVTKFVRQLDASRNLGLGESVSMMHPQQYLKGEPASDDRVQFMAQATPKQLTLNFDVDGIPLEGGDQLTPLILEFQIDARGYGKRRKFGFVDFVRVKFGLDGKPERLSELKPAVFGDWYNRALNNEELGATRTDLPDGRSRFTIAIPRSYLYLHEYALDNGNSQFGINAQLMFAKAGQPTNPYPADRHFKLIASGINRHSPESLSVLELVDEATGRWSVRLD